MFISNSCDCHLKSWRHAQYFSIKHKFKTLVEFYFLECVLSRSVLSNSFESMNHILPGSSVHGISQARILEWVAISYSRGSS